MFEFMLSMGCPGEFPKFADFIEIARYPTQHVAG
jgi:hypothetical protein